MDSWEAGNWFKNFARFILNLVVLTYIAGHFEVLHFSSYKCTFMQCMQDHKNLKGSLLSINGIMFHIS